MRLVVLGDPVDHSLSPLLHTAALHATGITGSYDLLNVDEAGMRDAVGMIATGDLDGASVTMPHKRLAADLSSGLAGDAVRTGAVNTLTRVGGEVIGHNTDVSGIRHAWAWGGLDSTGPILILGAGGAAAAALVALEHRPITVAARDPVALGRLAETTGVDFEHVRWGSGPSRDLAVGAVVVNATPLGMGGEELPSGVVDGSAGLFDMAYGTATTPAVNRARVAGVPVVDGTAMLLGQAVEAFRLWTGRPAPLEAMRVALRTELERRLGDGCG